MNMDLNALMKQAQQMQKDLQNTQSKLEETIYEGKSNGIVVKMNGKNECQSIEIPDELLEDKEMLQDMLMIAFNNANKEASQDRENQLGGITSGLNIPGM